MRYIIYKIIVTIVIVTLLIQLTYLVINGYIAEVINAKQTISCCAGIILLGIMLPIGYDIINGYKRNKLED
jgi:hypothetical protein